MAGNPDTIKDLRPKYMNKDRAKTNRTEIQGNEDKSEWQHRVINSNKKTDLPGRRERQDIIEPSMESNK